MIARTSTGFNVVLTPMRSRVGVSRGRESTLSTTVVAASHQSAALKAGRCPTEQIQLAEQQAQGLIIALREIIKDMQTGDPNITAFNTLITSLL
jgi:hypothetical protein